MNLRCGAYVIMFPEITCTLLHLVSILPVLYQPDSEKIRFQGTRTEHSLDSDQKHKMTGTQGLLNDTINRGSYMSAHVLFNLLNKLGKREKCELSLFRNEFSKFNNIRA